MSRHRNPVVLFGVPLLITIVAAAAGMPYWLGGPAWAWWLAAINLAAFMAYGLDKRLAQAQGLRVPELVLLGLALFGGAVGAFAGMQAFRHKTQKLSFRVWFWLIVAAQIAVAAWHFTRVCAFAFHSRLPHSTRLATREARMLAHAATMPAALPTTRTRTSPLGAQEYEERRKDEQQRCLVFARNAFMIVRVN